MLSQYHSLRASHALFQCPAAQTRPLAGSFEEQGVHGLAQGGKKGRKCLGAAGKMGLLKG